MKLNRRQLRRLIENTISAAGTSTIIPAGETGNEDNHTMIVVPRKGEARFSINKNNEYIDVLMILAKEAGPDLRNVGIITPANKIAVTDEGTSRIISIEDFADGEYTVKNHGDSDIEIKVYTLMSGP